MFIISAGYKKGVPGYNKQPWRSMTHQQCLYNNCLNWENLPAVLMTNGTDLQSLLTMDDLQQHNEKEDMTCRLCQTQWGTGHKRSIKTYSNRG